MQRNDATAAAKITAQAAMVSAMVTFVTSTLPPLHTAAVAAVNNFDSTDPTTGGIAPEDAAFYRACVQYTNQLIANKRYTGAALRYP